MPNRFARKATISVIDVPRHHSDTGLSYFRLVGIDANGERDEQKHRYDDFTEAVRAARAAAKKLIASGEASEVEIRDIDEPIAIYGPGGRMGKIERHDTKRSPLRGSKWREIMAKSVKSNPRYRIGDVIQFTGHAIDARDPPTGSVGACLPIATATGKSSPHPDPAGRMVYAMWSDGTEGSVWVRSTEKYGPSLKARSIASFRGTHAAQSAAMVADLRKKAANVFRTIRGDWESQREASYRDRESESRSERAREQSWHGGEQADMQCPYCDGDANPLGVLGNIAHYRCRQCGGESSRKVTKSNPGRTLPVKVQLAGLTVAQNSYGRWNPVWLDNGEIAIDSGKGINVDRTGYSTWRGAKDAAVEMIDGRRR